MNSDLVKLIEEFEKIGIKSKKLNLAFNLALKSHDGQFRYSGEPYFSHCFEVFKILKNEWSIVDEKYLIAGLIHDTVEDTDVSIEEIQRQFGNEIAELVSGVTKLQTNNDQETLKKVIDKTYVNPGVAIIKLADRLHNMRTMEFVRPERQVEKSKETLDIYSRLAESLGMWNVKTELEDLCFLYLDKDLYQETLINLENDPRLSLDFLSNLKSRIEQLLFDNNVIGQVEIKKSGYWILSEKKEKLALKGEVSFDSFKDINDLVSFRIKLDSLDFCYRVLNEIHQDFGEMVNYDRFNEFIGANKRVNGYQALQTTIDFPQGPVEISLVTNEMEEFNYWGVVSLINNNKDIKDYVLKLIFTPTESVRFLPKDATGVDFAAVISPRVLAEANSMDVDGTERPLTFIIPNASIVKINIGKSRRAPLLGLEDYALPKTKKLILEQRILEKKDILIKQGYRILELVLIPRGLLVLTDIGDSINPILYKMGCQGINDLYFMLGNGSVKKELIEKELDLAEINKEKLMITSIRLKGVDQPKILFDVVSKIRDIGKNIVHIDQKNSNSEFNIRILVENMTEDEENDMRCFLESDQRFNEGLVV